MTDDAKRKRGILEDEPRHDTAGHQPHDVPVKRTPPKDQVAPQKQEGPKKK